MNDLERQGPERAHRRGGLKGEKLVFRERLDDAAGQAAVDAGTADNVLVQPVGQTGDAYNAYPYLSACGGGIFNQDASGGYIAEEVIVNSEGSVKGAAALAELGAAGILSTSVGNDNAEGLFTGGKAAFYIAGPYILALRGAAG